LGNDGLTEEIEVEVVFIVPEGMLDFSADCGKANYDVGCDLPVS
jgi:hypothetical protein